MKAIIAVFAFLCGIFHGSALLLHGSQSNTTSTSIGQIDPSIQHQLQQLTTGLDSALKDITSLKQENQLLQQKQQIYELKHSALELQVQSLKTLNHTSQQRIKILEDSLHQVQSENRILKDELNNLNITSQELRLESQITHGIVQKIKTQDQEITRNMSASLQSQQHQLRYLSLSLVDIQNETNAQISKLEDQQNQTLMAEIQQLANTLDSTKANIQQLTSTSDSNKAKIQQLTSTLDSNKGEIQQLTSTLDVTTKSLNASVSNISTILGHRVAFTAGVRCCFRTLTTGQTVKYDSVIYQVGGGYDPSTGIFTTPKTGLYIIASTSVAFSGETFWTTIVVNGRGKAGIMAYNDAHLNTYQSASNLIVQQLQVGDRVWIKLYDGQQLYSSLSENTFSVIKIN